MSVNKIDNKPMYIGYVDAPTLGAFFAAEICHKELGIRTKILGFPGDHITTRRSFFVPNHKFLISVTAGKCVERGVVWGEVTETYPKATYPIY